MLPLGIADAHGGFNFFLRSDILNVEDFVWLRQFQTSGDFMDHTLRGADNQKPVVFLVLQRDHCFMLVLIVVE
jgi:hypothetical protein